MDSWHTGYNSQNGNETMRIMIIKSKIISLLLASVLFMFTACALASKERPYDSSFANAKEFAEYWCGPCEEIESYTVIAGNAEVIIHKFTDTEFGFTYTVVECRIRVSRLHLTIAEILIITTLKNSSTELTCHR